MSRKTVSGIMLTLLLTSMLTLAFNIQPVKTMSDATIGFYGISYEIYRNSLVSYLTTLGYSVFVVDELNFTSADVVYLDYRATYPLTEEELLDYVKDGGSLWVYGEAVGGTFLGVTISDDSIWFVGSLSDPRVWIMNHHILKNVKSIAYPDGAWLEVAENIEEIMRIDGKTMLAVDSSKLGKILWLIDSDIFGPYFLDDEDNRILARNIAAWLTTRTWTVDDDGPADFHTIQEAINAANPGDTIYVKAGIYSELISIKKNDLRIVGEEKTETIVDGIISIYANNISVGGFTIQGGGAYGVYLVGSSNIIWDNMISTGYYEGISISWYSSGNIIVHNLITPYEGTSSEVYGGIRIDRSNNNIIDKNIVSGRPWGITLYEAENNFIICNTIFACSRGGMFLMEQDVNNSIYHNNFINNTQQVYIKTPGYVNYWDDGYPSGGNYWSDYTGVDLYSGPYQNETGSDGIGDTPYFIDQDNIDNYPLMAQFSSFNVTWDGMDYPIDFVSNSTISNLNFDGEEKLLSFDVSGPDDTLGVCRVTIPKSLMEPSPSEKWKITVDGSQPLSTNMIEDENHTYLYLTYEHSTHTVEIKIISEEVRTLLGVGWGWMRLGHKEYVQGPAELYKIGDTKIELVITHQGEEYSRTWNIIHHREHRHHEIYFCLSPQHGPLIVGLHHARWTFWYAVGRDTIAFGFPRFGRLRLTPI